MEQELLNGDEDGSEQFFSPNSQRAPDPTSQYTASQASQGQPGPSQETSQAATGQETAQAGKVTRLKKTKEKEKPKEKEKQKEKQPAGPPKDPCIYCGANCTTGTIQCASCALWAHNSCTGLSKEALKGLEVQAKEVGKAYWACRSCMNFNNKWNAQMKEVSRRQDETDRRVDENSRLIEGVRNIAEEARREVREQANMAETLVGRMEQTMDDELREREVRRLNLVIHGVPEVDDEIKGNRERSEKDKEQCERIFITMRARTKKDNLRFCRRIGERGNDPRPIVIGLFSEEEKRHLLDTAKELRFTQYEHITFVPDLTKGQRKGEQRLRDEAQRRNNQLTREDLEKNLKWIIVGLRGEKRLIKAVERENQGGRETRRPPYNGGRGGFNTLGGGGENRGGSSGFGGFNRGGTNNGDSGFFGGGGPIHNGGGGPNRGGGAYGGNGINNSGPSNGGGPNSGGFNGGGRGLNEGSRPNNSGGPSNGPNRGGFNGSGRGPNEGGRPNNSGGPSNGPDGGGFNGVGSRFNDGSGPNNSSGPSNADGPNSGRFDGGSGFNDGGGFNNGGGPNSSGEPNNGGGHNGRWNNNGNGRWLNNGNGYQTNSNARNNGFGHGPANTNEYNNGSRLGNNNGYGNSNRNGTDSNGDLLPPNRRGNWQPVVAQPGGRHDSGIDNGGNYRPWQETGARPRNDGNNHYWPENDIRREQDRPMEPPATSQVVERTNSEEERQRRQRLDSNKRHRSASEEEAPDSRRQRQ